jgi:hypothetical protein
MAATRRVELVSFVYPRTIAITRPNTNDTPGDRGYSGVTKANETPIVSGLPASIQLQSKGGAPLGGTPSDAFSMSRYAVMIPFAAAALGLIEERDIVTDDLGKRYQVVGAYWNSLGHNLSCTLLEA